MSKLRHKFSRTKSPSPSPSLSSKSNSSSSSYSSLSSSFNSSSMDQAEVKKVFSRFDANGDGKISTAELTDILRALGSDAHPDEVEQMMAEMDSDQDGYVDFNEFLSFHLSTRNDKSSEEAELKEAFAMYDLDKNGVISAKELHQVMKKIGERCSFGDCVKMIKSVDRDGDGCVSFDEFKKMMGGGKSGSSK
ncbi:hypothetical protein LUZ60_012715 [Juncus effusus]|nr:hypothetical protein LUZ60_012715 [Juncus effusus]